MYGIRGVFGNAPVSREETANAVHERGKSMLMCFVIGGVEGTIGKKPGHSRIGGRCMVPHMEDWARPSTDE